jgi:hypothetical protein
MRSVLLAIAAVCLLSISGSGQTDVPTPADAPQEQPMLILSTIPPPATRLEKLAQTRDAVITRGYTVAGEMQADSGAVVRLSAVQVQDAARNLSEAGLMISVRQATTFIDSDEIDSLLAAIDALAKLDRSATALEQVEARFASKGDFELSNLNNNGGRTINVKAVQILTPTGRVIWGQASFPPSRLSELRRYVVVAKQSLDRVATPVGK